MQPLAQQLRPQTLEDYIGQKHLVGEDGPIRKAIEQKHLFSFLLWGPPGVGKTTLARIYAKALNAEFFELSAVSAGKEDIRKIIENKSYKSNESYLSNTPKILFLDEIHRFNKAQQDFLLPYVESGELTSIGATTENPSFEVIPALLSRCRVFVLNELNEEEIGEIINNAIRNLTPTLSDIGEGEKQWLVSMSGGDARQVLSMLENCISLYGSVTLENLKQTLQSKTLRYDKAGEEHYNTISAFIKSMRAGQTDAAIYYLTRMVESGEDPLFIARRMVIFASEDIGLAQPTALVVATAVFAACEKIGYPECAINLSHGAAYLANCKKDRSAYDALRAAQADVKNFSNLPVPLHIRNAPTQLMKDLGYGSSDDQSASFLPEKLKDKKYF